MHTYTKRFIEFIIVLALVVTGVTNWLEWRRARFQALEFVDLAETLNQAVWDKYGPGAKQPYLDLFSKYEDEIPDMNVLWSIFGTLKVFEKGLTGVEEAPESFQSILDGVERMTGDLRAVMEKGPFIAAPSEIDFATTEQRNPWSTDVQALGKALKLLATRDWMRGEHGQAIEHLDDIIRLGEAFPASYYYSWYTSRILYPIALDGFNLLTWTDPAAQDNRRILKSLQRIDKQALKLSPETLGSLWSYVEGWEGRETGFPPELLAGAALLMVPGEDRGVKTTGAVLRESGILPRQRLSFDQFTSRLGEWTILPAMRRRAARIPDSYFETDEVLSAEAAKKFPRLIYLSARYSAEIFHSARIARRTEVRRRQVAALEAAYRARCWHDEHSAWPTAEEFAASIPAEASFEWHITSASAPLVKQFMKFHGIKSENLLSDELNRNFRIGYFDVPKRTFYAQMRMGGYGVMGWGRGNGFSMGIVPDWFYDPETGNPLDSKKLWKKYPEKKKEWERAYAEWAAEWKGVVHCSVFLPRPPKGLPAPLTNLATSANYYIAESRKPPDCDATVVYQIPRDTVIRETYERFERVRTEHEELTTWASSVFKAFKPLVASVTEVNPPPGLTSSCNPDASRLMKTMGYGRYGADGMIWVGPSEKPSPAPDLNWWYAHPASGDPHVVIGLRFPKKSYWVTHPGPDGISDGPNLVYNPSNGITSRGDIVQLAGMSYE